MLQRTLARTGGLRVKFCLVAAAVFSVRAASVMADPPLPTFDSIVFNVTVANANINSGVAASTASTDNSAAINAYIAYCSSQGGGTVEIPAGTFLSGTITMQSNVNLQIDGGAILRDTNYANTLIKTSGATSNMEISGGGIIDGAATTTAGSADLVLLKKVNGLEVTGVTIENAGHEHLVTENDGNVTIKGITIADPGTLAANGGKYISNTDGIDFSGTNFLIENNTISDGDDDIVAKPASTATSNITITHDTIGAGHGISIGGGTAAGLSNMTVSNVTFNGTQNGLRLKAQDAAAYPSTPTAQDGTTPVFENIAFDDITATGASNGGLIYGLNTSPQSLQWVTFNNVNITADSHMDFWYASDVTIDGLTVNVPGSDPYADASPFNGVYLSNVSFAPGTAVPLPSAVRQTLPLLLVLFGTYWLYGRQSRRPRNAQ